MSQQWSLPGSLPATEDAALVATMRQSQEEPNNMSELKPLPGKLATDLWLKCAKCSALLYHKDYEKNLNVCLECKHHGRLRWFERLDYLLDKDSFVELNKHLVSSDVLNFRTATEMYADKLRDVQNKTGLKDALVTGCGKIRGQPVAIAVADFAFLGASMGSVFGEKLVRLVDLAIEYRLPLVTISTSGGARMHEGLFSLMQMAKTTVALVQLGKARLPHIAVLVDPCYGGVTASYTMAADVIIAEKGAMIGFAGPRVIEQVTRQRLPPGFQTAEFLLEHGMIDQVVERRELPVLLAKLVSVIGPVLKKRTSYGKGEPRVKTVAGVVNITSAPFAADRENAAPYEKPSPSKQEFFYGSSIQVANERKCEIPAPTAEEVWAKVQLARHSKRPQTLDLIAHMCDKFVELHGDRCYKDDSSLIGGVATLAGCQVMVIGHQKGHTTQENIKRNFGMPHPEGYRKSLRLFKLAEKLGFPILTLIDTPGAYPGLQSEERSVAGAISENLLVLADLHVPIISIVIGEGGSGGALAIGLSDRILMLENAIYSVASPEASASILWRDAKLASQAATSMKITSQELYSLGLIDEIIPEPDGGAHNDVAQCAQLVKNAFLKHLTHLEQDYPISTLLVEKRCQKFRAIGGWHLSNAD